MDYTTIHETAKFKLKDLGFTVYWKDCDKLNHTFFDYWSKEKKDYMFTAEAFFQLLSFPFFSQFQNVCVWSDNGLKSKEILYYFSAIAQSMSTGEKSPVSLIILIE